MNCIPQECRITTYKPKIQKRFSSDKVGQFRKIRKHHNFTIKDIFLSLFKKTFNKYKFHFVMVSHQLYCFKRAYTFYLIFNTLLLTSNKRFV